MKTKLLLMLASVLFAFASCNSNESVNQPDENEGDVWLSLKIKVPQSTRALNDPDVDPGTVDESNVETVKAILFDGFEPFSVVTNVTYVDVLGGATMTSAPFKVNRNAQSLLIIANPNEALMPLIEVGVTTYQEINQALQATVEDLIGPSWNRFMMTNASGLLEPWDHIQDPGITIQNFTKTSASETQQPGGAFSMNLDRVVSKVRVYNDIPGIPVSVGAMLVGNLEWGLNMTNKLFFPLSERIFTAIQTERGYPFTPPYTYVHSDPYGLGTYRIDPNFDGPGSPGSPFDPNTHAGEFNFYYSGFPSSFEINFKPATTGSSGESTFETNIEYCLENTFNEPFSYQAWTTHVIIRANVYPQEVALINGGFLPGPGPNTSWMRISGVDYTRESLNDRVQYELDGPNGVNSPFVQAFNQFLEQTTSLSVNLGNPLSTVKTEFEDVILNRLGTLNEVPSPMIWESTQYGSFAFYLNGVSYYKIMIKHDNDNDPGFENRLGEFGVVRNSVYDIRIKSITGPGFPEIPDPDPNTPNEINDMFIAIELGITPWTWYTQDEDL